MERASAPIILSPPPPPPLIESWTWQASWNKAGAGAAAQSRPTMVRDPNQGVTHVFAIGPAGNLVESNSTDGATWTSWVSPPPCTAPCTGFTGTGFNGPPTAVWADDGILIFARDAENNLVYTVYNNGFTTVLDEAHSGGNVPWVRLEVLDSTGRVLALAGDPSAAAFGTSDTTEGDTVSVIAPVATSKGTLLYRISAGANVGMYIPGQNSLAWEPQGDCGADVSECQPMPGNAFSWESISPFNPVNPQGFYAVAANGYIPPSSQNPPHVAVDASDIVYATSAGSLLSTRCTGAYKSCQGSLTALPSLPGGKVESAPALAYHPEPQRNAGHPQRVHHGPRRMAVLRHDEQQRELVRVDGQRRPRLRGRRPHGYPARAPRVGHRQISSPSCRATARTSSSTT